MSSEELFAIQMYWGQDFAAIMKNLKCHNIDVQQKKTLQLEGQ
jgi:hypothetical protein